ncbi:SAM-dependent chlorinase/fluorinase [Algoriphagus halophytocola]|uniref:SAM-dependent chlorinase/fluorinase n=1 Tax=Algoriphagus halophytocola TaxID=2991499 RepID=A0ABY6MLI9_9BACT|nr:MULTISPECIES: SAM-dependent chlorinase/fluorinase [unclassified Algoriphagus]UZD24632.1 SAM-dependent chlorinase/fluorinase [Algoriphagus sp. TR-M5]WBL42000.1 SAM-dependent chlorinase/fluorinase [Algoriphagus sp. TR-M9]
MALVTFLSDFGDTDYYVPAVKAKMLSINPQLNIIDISHKIETFDLAHAAFVLRSTFRDFPKGTVHLVAMNTTGSITQGYIGVKLEEHIFIGPNNGILSLLADHDPGILVQFADIHVKDSTFPAKDILAPIAAKVASGAAIHDFGGPLSNFRKLMSRQPKATRQNIIGHVLKVDVYGNLITNIRKEVFDQLNPGTFSIEFGRESVSRLQTGYDEVEPGDCFAFFNSLNLLEIGIYHGHGGNLLGLKYDSVVYVNFAS